MKSKLGKVAIIFIISINLVITIFLLLIFVPRVSAATGCFPDTNGHWAETFICWMSDSGLTGGYPDGTYKPENNVTRAEMAVFMKNSYDLVSGEDDDTLGSLSCATNQIAKWNGSIWECQADLSGSGSDTLGDLSCTTDQIAKWNGSAWVCGEDVDTDTDTNTLGDLSCATDEIARWNGSVWVCDSDLESRVADLETLLSSVSLENGGDDFVLTGVNVHVRDGSGDTDGTVNGLGNLIVGYNEDKHTLGSRTGSHNLVVGAEHSYTSYGGFVAGYWNFISGSYSTVSGGLMNQANGHRSSVSGGTDNWADGDDSSVSGGTMHIADGWKASISGGFNNRASGTLSSISGGSNNTASGGFSSVSGGDWNTASGDTSTVFGGSSNSAILDLEWKPTWIIP